MECNFGLDAAGHRTKLNNYNSSSLKNHNHKNIQIKWQMKQWP